MANVVPEVMTLEELAAYLRLSKSTLYKKAQRRVLPGKKIGKQWRFHKKAIDDWLMSASTRLAEEDGG
jgi:excisionase family DNA binding protein